MTKVTITVFRFQFSTFLKMMSKTSSILPFYMCQITIVYRRHVNSKCANLIVVQSFQIQTKKINLSILVFLMTGDGMNYPRYSYNFCPMKKSQCLILALQILHVTLVSYSCV